MARYQLKKRCLFVDAIKHKKPEDEDFATDVRKPDALPLAHVMYVKDDNGTPTSAKYLELDDAAGFIMRFLIQGVDTKIIADILVSEYYPVQANYLKEVEDLAQKLQAMGYLQPRKYNKRPYAPPGTGNEKDHPGKYPLDFSVNFFGAGFLKGPL